MPLPLAAIGIGMSAGSSLLGGIFGKRAAKKQAAQARAMAKYNASIIKQNAQNEMANIEAQGRRLTKSQREMKAQQAMSVASRGGDVAGGTDLLTLLEQAKTMQLDALELQRASDIAMISGDNRAAQTIYQGEVQAQQALAKGDQAMTNGILGAVGSIGMGFASGALKFPTGAASGGMNAGTGIFQAMGTNNLAQYGQTLGGALNASSPMISTAMKVNPFTGKYNYGGAGNGLNAAGRLYMR